MHWSDKYVGKQYIVGEYDCVVLAEDVLLNEFGIQTYFPKERDNNNVFHLSKRIDDAKDYYVSEINTVTDGCIILMKCQKRLNHIGIGFVKGGTPWVLHAMRSTGTVCAHRLRDLNRVAIEVEGIYTLNDVSNTFTESDITNTE